MSMSITSLTGNGFKDWIIQRVSAVYLALYAIFIAAFMMWHGAPLTYEVWAGLFSCSATKIATIVAVFMLLFHAWVGLWTVSTDYISCTLIRFAFQLVVLFTLVAELLWTIMMLGGL